VPVQAAGLRKKKYWQGRRAAASGQRSALSLPFMRVRLSAESRHVNLRAFVVGSRFPQFGCKTASNFSSQEGQIFLLHPWAERIDFPARFLEPKL
jgi:hypothetical protein